MMLQLLSQDPQRYIAIVLTVVISIVLHELAHGWAAIRRGDDTPIYTGHMTGNPLVHMPPMSLVMLALVGIAWGSMPIDPTRMRGRYAEAFVAFAGPAMNLLLAFVALTTMGLWIRFSPHTFFAADNHVMDNARVLIEVFGTMNLALFLFNLIPVPPLDGSKILENFSSAYARFINSEAGRGAAAAGFLILFFVAGSGIFLAAFWLKEQYLGLLLTGSPVKLLHG